MSIDVSGPDGSQFSFPDGTPGDVITAQLAKHYGGGEPKPAAYDRNDPRFSEHALASGEALRGIPIVGAAVDPAAAALNTITGKGTYAENRAQQEAARKDYEAAHPVRSAVEGMLGGGLALGGAAGAVPAIAKGLGMVGPLTRAVPAAVASGGALGGADAALRGEDPMTGAEVGALTGGLGVVGGKAIGKIWDAARGIFREAPAAVPSRTIPVNGVDVPVRESVVSRNPKASELEQGDIHGAHGPRAQAEARAAMEATDAALGRTHENLAASLDPTGASPSASPMAAGEAVGSEISAQEAARAAAEAGRIQGVGNETEAIRAALNTSPTPGVLADTPRTAAQTISEHLQNARDMVASARDRAYELLRGTPGEFNPAGFRQISNRLRQSLSGGTDPVRVTDTLTPHTAEALRDLETNVGQGRFENQAQTPLQMGPDGRPIARPITAETIDEARKRLISMQRAANDAARRTGDFTDVRGMRRVVSAFDDHVARVARTPGGFSGDAEQLLGRLDRARGAHATLKRAFGPANPQDTVGKAIEKIVGKRGVEPADHSTVQDMLFGNANEAGGAQQAALARRVIGMFGENSPQHVALKQGLLSHLADTPAGLEAMSHQKVADRMHKFFAPQSKGASLANTVFGLNERARILNHANRMRTAADPGPSGMVEKTIAKWSGRDGGVRASPKTIIDDLIGSTGQKGTSPMLVGHLKGRLSPAAFGKLKQGVWSRITEGAEGTIPWQDQKVGQRIMNFLNGDGKGLADALFTKAERDAMQEIGKAHIANLPVEGTTNPSKSGHVMERLARGAAHGIVPFLGFHAGGLPGAAIALAAKGGATRLMDRVAAKAARTRFYGPQPQAPQSRLPQAFGALGGELLAGQSR